MSTAIACVNGNDLSILALLPSEHDIAHDAHLLIKTSPVHDLRILGGGVHVGVGRGNGVMHLQIHEV